MTRPRLLFLSHVYPSPPDSGVKIRTYNLLRILSREYRISLIAFDRGGGHGQAVNRSDPALSLAEGVDDCTVFPIPQSSSKIRFVWDHIRSVVSQSVYTRWVYRDQACREAVKEKCDERIYDICHIDSLDLSPYLDQISGMPVVVGHHNIESELLARRAQHQDGIVASKYMAFQSALMEKEEKATAGRVALNVCVSPRDAESLRQLVPGAPVHVAPNGVDTARFLPSAQPTQTEIVFVGGTTWFPNKDALKHFAEDILPRIRARVEDVRVTWVGRSSEEEQRHYRENWGIDMTGYVDAIDEYVHRASCYVVPLRIGGGTRLKILDAWAMGKAVVTTSVGCEGLLAEDGKNALVRDGAEEFADAVARVLRDQTLRRRLEAEARETVVRTYDWKIIGSEMLRAYRSLHD